MVTRKLRLFSQMFALSFLVHLFFSSGCHSSNPEETRNVGSCVEVEKQALLKIKHEVITKAVNFTKGVYILPSWGSIEANGDCCKWKGVECANKSGHVISLTLYSAFNDSEWMYTGGNRILIDISPSLVDLRFLEYLDLSNIPWSGIPSFIGKLSQLRYFSLMRSEISGEIPPQLGNLSRLQVLDLRYNNGLRTKNFDWIFRLSSLREFYIDHVDLSKAHNWIEIFNKLPHLTSLTLQACKLPNFSHSPLSLVNSSTPLAFLNLGGNDFLNFPWTILFNFSRSLSHLNLRYNQLEGSIPEAIGNLTALSYLDLSFNKLEGVVLNFWNLCALDYFDVARNNLSRPFPKYNLSLSSCTSFSLSSLDLSHNPLEGVISEAHLSKLPKLSYLDLSYSSLTLAINSNWIPPFQLEYISLSSSKLGPLFPNWLQTQKKYTRLNISNSGISDSIPDWFWGSIPETCNIIDLSNNQIHGKLSNSSFSSHSDFYPMVDLSSNQLEGEIPQYLFKVGVLTLSMNNFSEMKSICDIVDNSSLSFLDISSNQLSGELPDCWSHFKELSVLILDDNKLLGKLPSSIGALSKIESLLLRNNNLIGSLPSSLGNCTKLTIIDVGENNLSGAIPAWIGKSLPNLVVLILRSNSFSGSISFHLCHLAHLQVLDLYQNNLSHIIPKCFGNFSTMKDGKMNRRLQIGYSYGASYSAGSSSYDSEIQLLWKGKLSKYASTLGLVKSIDVSSNNLAGEIPTEITDLVGLVSLNLSRNKLNGKIPLEIGKLGMLDVLDLSNNQLYGEIPSSLAQVHRLSTLDLSNNSLDGKIPTSTQLQSFNATVYMGNPGLCGDPLPKKCSDEEPSIENDNQKLNHDAFLRRGFYISMGLGFFIGFWGSCGSLIFVKSWRYTYFKFWDEVQDTLYVMVVLRSAKIMRLIKSYLV